MRTKAHEMDSSKTIWLGAATLALAAMLLLLALFVAPPVRSDQAPPVPAQPPAFAPQSTAPSCNTYDISLSVSPTSFRESADRAQNITLTGTRRDSSGALTVTYSPRGGNATNVSDYTILEYSALTFADGETTTSVTLPYTPVDDDDIEGDEAIVISAAVPGKTVGDAVITLKDDDTDYHDDEDISLWVNSSQQFLSEGAGATQITVYAGRSGSEGDLTVDLQLKSSSQDFNTATQNTDYTITDLGSITIPNESSSSPSGYAVTVTPVDDATYEGNEHILITGTSGSSTVGDAHIVILDNEYHSVRPGRPTVSRTRFAEESAPALDASWTGVSGLVGSFSNYEVRHCKQGDTRWTAQSQLLPHTATSINLPGLEAGATYHFQARALNLGLPHGGWSSAGSAQANSAPRQKNPITSTSVRVPVTSGIIVRAVDFTDADSDPLTPWVKVDEPALIGVRDGEGEKRAIALNPGTSNIQFGAHDGYGGYSTIAHAIEAYQKEFRDVVENSPAGAKVGDPVKGEPYNGETLSYTLTGNVKNSGKFAIDSATGQISVAEGATIDYEAPPDDYIEEADPINGLPRRGYRGNVNYTVGGHTASIEVIIMMVDVDETRPTISSVARTRFEEQSAPALDVTWVAPTEPPWTVTGYNVQYRKQGDTDWTAHSSTLSATTTTVNLSSLEAGATYEMQVRAVGSGTDVGAWSETATGQANRAPRNTAEPAVRSVKWFGKTGVRLEFNDVHFADDDDDKLTFAPDDDYPGLLRLWIKTLDSGRRELWIAGWNPFEGEKIVTFHAYDGYGGIASNTVKVTIWTSEVSRRVPENSPSGANVGTPVTGRPYDGEAYTYSLSGEAATSGKFAINSATGQITVAQGATLDYETKSSYNGKVRFTVQGQDAVINVTINVTEVVPGKPSMPQLTRTEFPPDEFPDGENPALDVTWTVPDETGVTINGFQIQYRKQGDASWTDYNDVLSARDNYINLEDLEAGATYEVRIRTSTSRGYTDWSDTGTGQANGLPEICCLVKGDTGRLSGIPFGAHRTRSMWTSGKRHFFTDPDDDQLTYAASAQYPGILSGVGASFSESRGVAVMVHKGLNPSASRINYTIQDGYGGVTKDWGLVTVRAYPVRHIQENSPAGTKVGRPLKGNPYDLDGDGNPDETFTYTWTGEAAESGLFALDAGTGQVTVAELPSIDPVSGEPGVTAPSLDFETKSSYTGKVLFTVQGQPAVINFTIFVTPVGVPGVPDAPAVAASAGSPRPPWTCPGLPPRLPGARPSPVTMFSTGFRMPKNGRNTASAEHEPAPPSAA